MDSSDDSAKADEAYPVIKSIWTGKYRGLRIATLGFLVVLAGGLPCLVAGIIRDNTDIQFVKSIAGIVSVVGYSVALFGFPVVFAGIVIGWWSIIISIVAGWQLLIGKTR